MAEDRDILVLVNEDDEEIEMEILDYFTHEDEEYALLAPLDDDCDDDCDCEEHELYIMRVVVNGDMEEFHPVDDDKMESLMDAVEAIYGGDGYDDDDYDDDDYDDDDDFFYEEEDEDFEDEDGDDDPF